VPVVVRQLSGSDANGVASLWQSATDQRRRETGLQPLREQSLVLARPGVFAVGAVEGEELLAMALAVPARADDGRSEHNVPGLAHISSVATRPGEWGRGLGGRCVRAVMSQATRRGYARVQLWTHSSNAGARRLYEREGFELSGRRKTDDHGEPIVHYLRELPVIPWMARHASRLVCLDPDDRVLLLHWSDPVDGYRLWEPPGGGVEAGESSYDAVVREWREETGLPLPAMTDEPTLVGRDVIFNGTRSIVDEEFFLGRATSAGTPQADEATAMEQDAFIGHAWVPWRQLSELDDPVEPDLLPVLRRLAPSRSWET
jgi:8-oxo-dGTP pyrophosphatase MutT (NUDIX family)/ribosomal protein S18 acetylase RimI-like enzyme